MRKQVATLPDLPCYVLALAVRASRNPEADQPPHVVADRIARLVQVPGTRTVVDVNSGGLRWALSQVSGAHVYNAAAPALAGAR